MLPKPLPSFTAEHAHCAPENMKNPVVHNDTDVSYQKTLKALDNILKMCYTLSIIKKGIDNYDNTERK